MITIHRFKLPKPPDNLDHFWEGLASHQKTPIGQHEETSSGFIDMSPQESSDLVNTRPTEGSLLSFRWCSERRKIDPQTLKDAFQVWRSQNDGMRLTKRVKEEIRDRLLPDASPKRKVLRCYVDLRTNYLLVLGSENDATTIRSAFDRATGLACYQESGAAILRHTETNPDVLRDLCGKEVDLTDYRDNDIRINTREFLRWLVRSGSEVLFPVRSLSVESNGITVSWRGDSSDRADVASALLDDEATVKGARFALADDLWTFAMGPDLVPVGAKSSNFKEPSEEMILDWWDLVGKIAAEFYAWAQVQGESRERQDREACQKVVRAALVWVRKTGQITLWEEEGTELVGRSERVIPVETDSERNRRASLAAMAQREL